MSQKLVTAIIYPAPDEAKEVRFGYSVQALLLATLAKTVGETYFLDMTLSENAQGDLVNIFQQLSIHKKPRVVIYLDSVPLNRSGNIRRGRQLMSLVRDQVPNAFAIACGNYCMTSLEHEELSDYTIVHEPELELVPALLQGPAHAKLPDIAPASGKPLLIEDLDALPVPDRSLLPSGSEHRLRPGEPKALARSAVVCTTRGCSGSCTFCPRRAWTLGRVRHRSLHNVEDEIGGLIEQGYRNIWIDDDNMAVDQDRSLELFRRIQRINTGRRCGFYISSWGKADKSLFRAAAAAGVRVVSFGLESGSDSVLRYFAKPTDVSTSVKAIRLAHECGIFTVANIIIGAPCETDEVLTKTTGILSTEPIDSVNVKILSYIRGSILWDVAVRRGQISSKEEWVLADARNGTSNRSLEVLKRQQQEMRDSFRRALGRTNRLMDKIRRVGTPYILNYGSASKIACPAFRPQTATSGLATVAG